MVDIYLIPFKKLRGLILVVIVLFLFGGGEAATKARRVLVLPLTIHAEKDLSFLQAGIRSMLSSRLNQPGKTVIIGREETRQAVEAYGEAVTSSNSAVALARQLGADYVVLGSLVMLGDSISTDIKLLAIDQIEPVVAVNEVGKTQGAVIEHIDLFCARVNEDVFGKGAAGKDAVARKPGAGQPAAKAQDQDVQDTQRMHPEKLMQTDVMEQPSPFGVQPGVRTAGAWRIGRQFKAQLRGLAMGDINGDGRTDLVVIDNHRLQAFQFRRGRLIHLGTLEEGKFNTFLSVDVADINDNGRAEIFISNRPINIKRPIGYTFPPTRTRVISMVVEWDGQQFTKIVEKDPRFFRVHHLPHRGPVLVGQRQGRLTNTEGDNEIFTGPVSELVWRGGAYVEEESLQLPRRTNLYNFAIGDVDDNGKEKVLSFTLKDYLRVTDRSGSEEWQSAESFGSTAIYLEIPDQGTDQHDLDKYYLPTRITVVPSGGGKTSYVIAVKNTEAARVLPRTKFFRSGHIEFLTWNGLSFMPAWRTQPVSKFICDYALGDLDQDGQDELVFAVVVKTKGAFSEGKSTIVYQDLPDVKSAMADNPS